MKVAIITNGAPTLVNFRGPLIVEMVRRGYGVLAFAPDHNTETRRELERLGAEPVDFAMSRAGLNPLQDAATLVELTRLFRKHRPDVSFAYFIKPVIYATLAARLAGIRRRYAMIEGMGFIFTAGTRPSMSRSLLQWIAAQLLRLSLSFATLLVLLNEDDHREFVEKRLVRPQKAVLLGGIGVDLAEWSYHEPATDPVTFVFVGRLLLDKGVEEFVAAARMVRAESPNARFILLGGLDVNPTAIARSRVDGWVKEGTVSWPGHVPVRPALMQASVFVLPSYREGVPRSTQEAMALGLPVITTDVPGCRDTVLDGVNGFLVSARDSVALAKAMRHFVAHPHNIIPMGRQSRRIAEERFDVHRQNARLLKWFEL